MEHINAGIICHYFFHAGKCIEKELIELIVFQVVVLDFACGALVIYIIRRIRHHKVCFLAIHQQGVAFFLGAVTAEESVIPEQPEITAFCDRRLFQLRIHIEIIIFCIVRSIKKACQLRFIETSQT